jgi:TPR repeat protein
MGIFSGIKSFFTPDPEVDFQFGLREETLSGNYAKAAWLYQKAVDRGHVKAKYFLAVLYLMGRGVTEDRDKALALLKESAAAGYDKAKKLLSDIQSGEFR